jgi:ribosomal protein S18 acetylase RimI-like enzyme
MDPERLASRADAEECARIMVASDPWLTLKRDVGSAQRVLLDAGKEVYLFRDDEGITAFIILDLRGSFAGYIQTICVRPDRRGHRVGATLLGWAERRIFEESPNVFLCVSSFNHGARRLYERLGYETVGSLRGFVVPEHDEILMRKSIGPWAGFHPPDATRR